MMADTPAKDSNSCDALDEPGGHHFPGSLGFLIKYYLAMHSRVVMLLVLDQLSFN